MAHNLEQLSDGSFSFVAAREPGWHNLGKVYTDLDGLTLETVLTDLNVGEIIECPAVAEVDYVGEMPQTIEFEDKKAILRKRVETNTGLPFYTPLGIVGKNRPIVPEREAFGFLQQIVDDGEAQYQTAGLLDGGKRAFCSLKFPEGLLIGGVDPIDLFLMVVVSHDSSLSLTGAATPVRAVCQNTVTMGLAKAKQTWKIRHTKNMKLNPEVARKQLDLTFAYTDAWTVAAEKLVNTPMATDPFDEIVRNLYAPTEETPAKMAVTLFEQRRERLHALNSTAPTQENVRGTAWGAYNAIVEDLDWFLGTRNVAEADQDGYRFARSLTEGATDEKTRAFDLIMAFADAQ